jgi:hypothetical protein
MRLQTQVSRRRSTLGYAYSALTGARPQRSAARTSRLLAGPRQFGGQIRKAADRQQQSALQELRTPDFSSRLAASQQFAEEPDINGNALVWLARELVTVLSELLSQFCQVMFGFPFLGNLGMAIETFLFCLFRILLRPD